MVKYICKRCKKSFNQKIDYDRHINRKRKCHINKSKTNKKDVKYYCNICKRDYNKKDALIQHRKTKLHKSNITKLKNTKKINTNNNICKNKSFTGSYNKNNNIHSNNTTNNYYFISPFSKEETNKLSNQDKFAIFSSEENPLVMIILMTNLNPKLSEYHNVGYTDLNSRYGIVFNGKTWEKKDIQTIMNELLNSKRKDMLKIYKEIQKYLSVDDNKNINDVLCDVENNVMPKLDHHVKSKKNLVANLKTHFYNRRDLINKSIKKSGKPILEPVLRNKTRNILKKGLTMEEVDRLMTEDKIKSEKIVPKKEIAKYILLECIKIENKLNNNQIQKINEIIDDIIEENEINIIVRLLSIIYCGIDNIDINIDIIKQKNNIEHEVIQLIENNLI